MICRRHGFIATHTEYGQPFCLRCFAEALEARSRLNVVSDNLEVETLTLAELMRRLGAKWP